MLQNLAQFLVKNTKNYNVLDIDSKHFQIRFRFSSSESSTRFPNPILDALASSPHLEIHTIYYFHSVIMLHFWEKYL